MPDEIDKIFIAMTEAFKVKDLDDYEAIISNPIHTVVGITSSDISRIVDLFMASGGDPDKFRNLMLMKSMDAPEIIIRIMKSFFIASVSSAINQRKV